jgi:hypothetical protein
MLFKTNERGMPVRKEGRSWVELAVLKKSPVQDDVAKKSASKCK